MNRLVSLLFVLFGVFAFTSVSAVVDDAKVEELESLYYTTYSIYDQTQLRYMTCGFNSTISGCFGGGNLDFGRVCSVASNEAKDKVFVIDAGTDSTSTLQLSIYDQVQSPTPSLKLAAKLDLSRLSGGPATKCFLATLGKFIYVATNETSLFSQVNWKTLDHNETSYGGTTTLMTVSKELVVISQGNVFTSYDKDGKQEYNGGQFGDTFAIGSLGYSPE